MRRFLAIRTWAVDAAPGASGSAQRRSSSTPTANGSRGPSRASARRPRVGRHRRLPAEQRARPCGCRRRRRAGRPAASRRSAGSSGRPKSCSSLRDQLAQAERVGRPAAEVEDLARDRVDPLRGALVGVDQVADPERVADLLAVAEDRERLAESSRRRRTRRSSPGPRCRTAACRRCTTGGRRPSAARRSGRSRGRTGRPPPSSSRRGCGSRAARPRRRRTGGRRRRSGRRARRPRCARGCRRPCWSSCRGRRAGPPAAVRTASRTLNVPRALVSKSVAGVGDAGGDGHLRGQVEHGVGIGVLGQQRRASPPASRTSAWTNVVTPCPRSQSRLVVAPRRLRLSTTTTWCPAWWNRAAAWQPMKPAPPVMIHFMMRRFPVHVTMPAIRVATRVRGE